MNLSVTVTAKLLYDCTFSVTLASDYRGCIHFTVDNINMNM